jgi:amino acid transporter
LCAGSIYTLINYVSFVLWVSTGVAVAALLVLRRTKPDLPRPIKVSLILPYLYILCTIFIVSCSIYADYKSTGIADLNFLYPQVVNNFEIF